MVCHVLSWVFVGERSPYEGHLAWEEAQNAEDAVV